MPARGRTGKVTTRTRAGRTKTRQPRRPPSWSWVHRVAETSNAMDLPPGIFTRSPRAVAQGLKQSVLASARTKGTKFQSAMSMLNLFINRSGKNLTRADRARLEAAKDELRRAFGREPRGRARARVA